LVKLAGSETSTIDGFEKVVANATKTGFETMIRLGMSVIPRYARVAALDIKGTILGSSPVVDLITGAIITVNSTITTVVAPPPVTPNVTSTSAPSSASGTAAPSETKKDGVETLKMGTWSLLVVAVGLVLNYL
jgi:hypothetical protein